MSAPPAPAETEAGGEYAASLPPSPLCYSIIEKHLDEGESDEDDKEEEEENVGLLFSCHAEEAALL